MKNPFDTTQKAALERIASPICTAHGVRLVDLRFGREQGGAVLRVFIEREGGYKDESTGSGVTLSDCQEVSRDLSTAIDVHEVELGSYRLEVSSPGLERPLVRLEDFDRFEGREVRVETKTPLALSGGGEASSQHPTSRRRFQGKSLGSRDGGVVLEEEAGEVIIPYDNVREAHLIYRFDAGTAKRSRGQSRPGGVRRVQS